MPRPGVAASQDGLRSTRGDHQRASGGGQQQEQAEEAEDGTGEQPESAEGGGGGGMSLITETVMPSFMTTVRNQVERSPLA